MARGPKKHMKRITAPKSWLISKMGGVYTVRPAQGPHKLRKSIPLELILRHKLKLALNHQEAYKIMKQKEGLVLVDQKVRRNPKFPVGLMDVVSIPKCGYNYRLLYDVKGRFTFTKLSEGQAGFKLCRVQKKSVGSNQVVYLVTHDGRTIRFADRDIKTHDTVKFDFKTREVLDFYQMKVGNLAYISDGNNRGRVGRIVSIKQFPGSNDLVTLQDAKKRVFTTKIWYVFVIGKGEKAEIRLPKRRGLKMTILEEAEERLKNERERD